MRSTFSISLLVAGILLLSGCNTIPSSGFLRSGADPKSDAPNLKGIQIVDITDGVVRELLSQRSTHLFSEAFPAPTSQAQLIGKGDILEVAIWEAPPATLFSAGAVELRGTNSTARPAILPEQMVASEGYINVAFAGKILAAGKTLQAIEEEITKRLKGKANQPEVMVRLMRNISSSITVVGEVTNSLKVPLTPGGEKLLDALAAAGGVRLPVSKMTIQLTRGDSVYSLPLDTIIRDPKQNIALTRGDVITAISQPLSFTALGATGKNEEVNFEAQGITLTQALARAGGLQDARSDPQGVFIFRMESANALNWPKTPVVMTPEGKVPVIYRVDLRDPASFFMAQSFQINNKDVLYIANAPAAELQKFLNVVFSIVYPLLNARAVFP